MEHNLTYLRQQIDEIDSQIFDLFIKRIYLAKEIGLYKKQHNLPIFDTEREKINEKPFQRWFQKKYNHPL